MTEPVVQETATRAAPRTDPDGFGALRAVFRVQRALTLGAIALCLLQITALVVYRLMLHRRLTELRGLTGPSCPRPLAEVASDDCQGFVDSAVSSEFVGANGFLRLATLALAIGVGALVGAPVLAREFEQRTQVLSLTQSISRARWWSAKVLIALVPLVVALLAVGFTGRWAFSGWPYADNLMGSGSFLATSVGPALIGLLAACVAITVGVLWRSTLGAVIVALILTAGAVYGGEEVRPYSVAADRVTIPVDGADFFASQPAGSWYVDGGYADATENAVAWDYSCPLWAELDPEGTASMEVSAEIQRRCYDLAGITSFYTDSIPGSRFGLVRTLWSGGFLLLSGFALLVGWLRLRRRVL